MDPVGTPVAASTYLTRVSVGTRPWLPGHPRWGKPRLLPPPHLEQKNRELCCTLYRYCLLSLVQLAITISSPIAHQYTSWSCSDVFPKNVHAYCGKCYYIEREIFNCHVTICWPINNEHEPCGHHSLLNSGWMLTKLHSIKVLNYVVVLGFRLNARNCYMYINLKSTKSKYFGS